eukprot:CAMPEP_0181229956 /NCGR_PEP_ID=MMETSP1096-20121128/34189_1 /TAXON_ID=156174 ORGANISM="Chrysochromulina ericina, Strain CCMP281" /NCGR_SAMPLE_ID=MMETSP1096 /ASSEMBLY_ACC=CAM_ASM_000453 /LENGTH=94 /DNA_ID=CAMNT_0023323645 /DNA_START=123 /DNA_END=407 /DNA_ORIENTATION=+
MSFSCVHASGNTQPVKIEVEPCESPCGLVLPPPGKGEPSRVKHPQLTQHRPIGALDGCAPHPAGSVLVVQDVQVNPTKDPLHHWVLGPPYDIPF